MISKIIKVCIIFSLFVGFAFCSQRPSLQNDIVLEKGKDTVVVRFSKARLLLNISIYEDEKYFFSSNYDSLEISIIEIKGKFYPLEYYTNKWYSYTIETCDGHYEGGFSLVDKTDISVIKKVDFEDRNIEIIIENEMPKRLKDNIKEESPKEFLKRMNNVPLPESK